jgi:hypothetical protein
MWTAVAERRFLLELRTPMRIAAASQAKVRTASQRKLRSLLRGVPIYAKLLDEHRVVVVSVLHAV